MFPVDLYAASLIAYFLLRTFTPGYYWPVELISIAIHWLLLMGIFLLPFALWKRHRPAVALLGVCSVMFLWLFGGLFLPQSIRVSNHPSGSYSRKLTVMTYNLGNGIAPTEHLTEVIVSSNADIVAIQEMTAAQIPGLKSTLQVPYPYQVFHGAEIPGIGLLSKYPIVQHEVLIMQGSHPYLIGILQLGEESLRVIVAHPSVAFGPGAPQSPTRADIPMLAELAVEGEKTIVLGDLNFTDQNEGYDLLISAGLMDTFRAAGYGFGFTYPQRTWSGKPFLPLIRIDFILVTKDLHPLNAWVGSDGGSDHLPMLAELSL